MTNETIALLVYLALLVGVLAWFLVESWGEV